MYELLKILSSNFLSSVRVLQMVLGSWKWMNFMPFSENLWCSRAQWMNQFWIVEFHVFPVKDDHYELRGLLWNYNIMGLWNSSNFMLFSGFWGTNVLSMDWIDFY